jgi:cholesterol oxidase
MEERYDSDWIVVGSGFGGSVSALRLAEKGYSVQVLECGKRYEDHELPMSSWNMKRFMWVPLLKWFGLMRISIFKDVTILSGSGVGGGSLAYAATLYRAADEFYGAPDWAGLADWQAELAPHYDTAERMLGATEPPFETESDRLTKRIAKYTDCEDTFQKTKVGILFGDVEGQAVADPYFGGAGPDRTTCQFCSACMQGCPFGAKNTTRKNYLWFAEKLGVRIHELTNVVAIRPLGADDGSDGYELVAERTGAWFFKRRRVFKARGVVVAAGALNTNKLLGRSKVTGDLPKLSDRIGESVRTNSETLLAVSFPEERDFARGVPITSSIFPDEDSHIELVHPGRWGGGWKPMFTMLLPQAPLLLRPLVFLWTAIRHPAWFARSLWPFGWVQRSIILGQMQTVNNAIKFVFRKTLTGRLKMDTEQDPDHPLPRNFELAEGIVKRLAKEEGAIPQSMVFEAFLGRTVTAHILGGASIGKDARSGVVDAEQKVFGYANLVVCDGSVFPANPGVNPSLTITALAERAMSFIPAKAV